jgi:hypothetical protein
MEASVSEDKRWRAAGHEAGHAVAGAHAKRGRRWPGLDQQLEKAPSLVHNRRRELNRTGRPEAPGCRE